MNNLTKIRELEGQFPITLAEAEVYSPCPDVIRINPTDLLQKCTRPSNHPCNRRLHSGENIYCAIPYVKGH